MFSFLTLNFHTCCMVCFLSLRIAQNRNKKLMYTLKSSYKFGSRTYVLLLLLIICFLNLPAYRTKLVLNPHKIIVLIKIELQSEKKKPKI